MTKQIKQIKIEIENANLRQWFIVKSANFLLWLLYKVHSSPEILEKESKDIIKSAFNAIFKEIPK